MIAALKVATTTATMTDRIHLARISSISALSVKLPDQQETKPSWCDTVVGMEHGFQVEPLREW